MKAVEVKASIRDSSPSRGGKYLLLILDDIRVSLGPAESSGLFVHEFWHDSTWGGDVPSPPQFAAFVCRLRVACLCGVRRIVTPRSGQCHLWSHATR